MRATTRIATGAGLGIAAAPAYLLIGLTSLEAAVAAALAGAGSACALLIRGRTPPTTVALPARKFADEAMADVSRLRRAARALDDAPAVASVLRIAESAAAGIRNVIETKVLDQASRRVVAYYLPQAANLAQALVRLQDSRRDTSKERADIGTMLTRLEPVFYRFEDRSDVMPGDGIARDLALLEQSLRTDGENDAA